jgi:4-amino-4-deoxy-L-arabinose transferase-like glycosyltransferase
MTLTADAPETPHRVEQWLRRHRAAVVAAIVAVSALFRVAYFVQLARGPCLWHHRWTESDMSFFDAWAKSIVAGDWLTDRSLHPVHEWTRALAEQHFRAEPQDAQQLEAEASPSGGSAVERLWDRWYGGKRFHQEPLYPYMVAATYAVLGPDVRWVFAWQMLLGILGNVLVWLLARRSFGDTVGAVAAGMCVLYGPLLFYEAVLLREAPLTLAGLAAAWAMTAAMDRDRPRWWVCAGAVIGLAALLKSTYVLMLLGALPAAWGLCRGPSPQGAAPLRSSRSRPAWHAGALAAGFAAVLVPVAARNAAVGVPPLAVSSVGSVVFILANAEGFRCGDGYASFAWDDVPPIMHRTGGALGAVAVETLRTHESAWSVLGQLVSKFAAVWHWYEIPNNVNFYLYGEHAPVLRWLPLRFVALAPLGIVGMALAWRKLAGCWPLLLLLASGLLPLVAFGTLGRYRMPLVPVLAIFAAVAAVRIVELAAARRVAAAAMAAAFAGSLALVVGRPVAEGVPLVNVAEYAALADFYYRPEAERAAARGDVAAAAALIAEALAREPDLARQLGPARRARSGFEAGTARAYGSLHRLRAEYLERAGRAEEAQVHRARSEELDRAAGAAPAR